MVDRNSWRTARFAVLDVETTGLDPSVSELISLAVVPIDNARVHLDRAIYRAVKPGAPPQRADVLIHGIVAGEAMAAPSLESLIDEVVEALSDRILVAHVASVERTFLLPALPRLGIRRRTMLDTDMLMRELIRRRSGVLISRHLPLSGVAVQLGVPAYRQHHALGDAVTTAGVFLALAHQLDPEGRKSAAGLNRCTRLLSASLALHSGRLA